LCARGSQEQSQTIETVLVLHPGDVLRNGRSIRGIGFTLGRRSLAYLGFSKFFTAAAFGRRSR